MLYTLRQVAEWFGGIHGRRKSMLFFSEGIDYDLNDIIRSFDAPPSSASSIMNDIRDTVTMTARSNVSIYAIDPRGLADARATTRSASAASPIRTIRRRHRPATRLRQRAADVAGQPALACPTKAAGLRR